MIEYASFLLVFLASFLATRTALPFFIQRMHVRGMIGKDMNKPGKPEVAEMGGTMVLLGFVFAVMVALFVHSYANAFPGLDLLAVLAAMLTIVLVGILGIVDDLVGWKKGIRQYQHAIVPLFAALPLMVLPTTIGNTGVDVPFFGFVNFGIFYALILIPLAVTGASNATNMLAGLNGLEAGMGLLNAFALLLVGIILGEMEVVVIMLSMIGAILAFMKFNWFPAKIFPGDSFTLMTGAAIASASIIGNMEKIGLMLFALYFVELLLKARTKMQAESFGVLQEDGTLQSPARLGSLTHWVMRRGKFTEKQVVLILLTIQGVVVVVTLLFFWINYSLSQVVGLRL